MKKSLVVFGVCFFVLMIINFVVAETAINFDKVICMDTDGGKEIYTKGITSGQEWGTGQEAYDETNNKIWIEPRFVNFTDFCITEGSKKGRLVEYFCYGNLVASGTSDCVCEDGVCVDNIPFPSCSENQCERNKVCYKVGKRIEEGLGEYCGDNGVMKSFIREGGHCNYNYECEGNICSDSICVDATEFQRNSFLGNILNWFKKLFGGK